MLISYKHQGFIFGVVLKEFGAIVEPITIELGDNVFKFRPSPIKTESLRDLLKHLDLDYLRDEDGKPLSYTKIETKDMTKHIEWIVRTAALSGVELPHITAEWSRIMTLAHRKGK